MIDHSKVTEKYIQDTNKNSLLGNVGITNNLISKEKLDKFSKLYLKESKSVVDEIRIQLLEFQLNLSLPLFQTDLETLKKDLDALKLKSKEKPEGSKKEEVSNSDELVNQNIKEIYNQIEGEKPSLESFSLAYVGYENLSEKIENKRYLTIVDFSKSREEKRLYTIDLKKKKVTNHTQVGHGKKSGGEYADDFGNISGSNKSSLGFMLSSSEYENNSKNTWEGLRLYGVEEGVNDKTDERGIFMHPGTVEGSEGCMTIPKDQNPENVMKKIKGKSLIFAYYPDDDYIANSDILKDQSEIAYS